MKVKEAYELISKLKSIKSEFQRKYDDVAVANNLKLFRKIRSYNEEIERLTDCIMNMEFDDSYEFNYDLYYIKDENE